MTPQHEAICQAGQALFGSEWHHALAKALEVSPRTMRRWGTGTAPIPPKVWGEVLDLLEERIKIIARAGYAVSQQAPHLTKRT